MNGYATFEKLIFVISGRGVNHYDIKALRQSGSKVVVAIVNDNYRHTITDKTLNDFDEVCFVSTSSRNYGLDEVDEEETRKLIHEKMSHYRSEHQYIVCANEGNMVVSASLRSHFNIPGLKHEDVFLFRNKCMMKTKLADNGVNTAKFIDFDINLAREHGSYYENIVQELGSPFVLKPKSSGGGKDVYIVKSSRQFSQITNDICSAKYEFFAESIIMGGLYHCDIMIHNREVVFSECSKYNWDEFDEGSKHQIISSLPLENSVMIKNKIVEFCEKIISILGALDGTYHIEVFEENGELVFLELGLRMPGTLIPKMYELMYDCNLWNIDLSIQCDFFAGNRYKQQRYALWAYFLEYEVGTIVKVEPLNENVDGFIDWYYGVGDAVSDTPALTGSVVYSSNSYEEIVSVFDCFRSKSPLVLEKEVN
ncbi:ATP-grasp domain-containing protein [Vibrio profundum]|uniref:ATP-grasp domain-containing protein n=1 Tax=Vibrio profundum TaxID=2910247 RepID=UPI003D14E13D